LRRLETDYCPDIIHAHMAIIAVMARAVTIGRPTKVITSVHNVFEHKARLMAIGHRVICVSNAVKQSMLLRGVPERKLRAVVNGPLGSPRSFSHSVGPGWISPKFPSIVVVAGLYQRKGIQDLISAVEAVCKVVPAVNLHILGEGPDRPEFENQVRNAGVQDNVHFHGFVRDPRPYLQAADIFVLPSHRESFGLAIVEARQAGCAIIASDVDGIPEALDNGEAGILVPPQRPDLLAKELLRLLQNRDELALWRRRAGSNLDWLHCGRVARETLDVYREALGLKQTLPDLVQLPALR